MASAKCSAAVFWYMISSLRDDDPSAAWDGDSRLKPRCSCCGQTAGGGCVGTGGQYSARTRPYSVGYPNSILPDPGTGTWYMAPTRGLDLAATQQYRELPEDA